MYALQEVPGKGRGLVATRKISKGTRILSEEPIIRVPEAALASQTLLESIHEQVDALTLDQRRAFLSLHNIYVDDAASQYLGIIRTNALPFGDNVEEGGIFLDACLLNHACDNNAQKSWNENIKRHTVHALRDIEKGEEITIYYLGVLNSRKTRRETLERKFAFTCSCRLCSLPLDQSQESDRRLNEIVKLDGLISRDGLTGIVSTPLHTLRYIDLQIRLYNEHGPDDVGLPRAFFDAAQIAIANGDLARARVFAERAVLGWIVLSGDDSPNVLQYRALSQDPSKHELYGTTETWKTAVDDIPVGLGSKEFDDWLWRRKKNPRRRRTASKLKHLGDVPGLKEIEMPLFEIKDIPGKGKGLIARVNISSGTRILCEKPLLTVRAKSRQELEPFLMAKMKALPESSQRQFLALHNNFPGKYPLSGIVKTNALPCGPDSPVGGVYSTVCFINHSCIPNAHNNWNSAEEHETIHAIRMIERGAEITISYDHGGASSERQTFLKESFGFTCTCSGCTLSPSFLQASDNRRTQIQSLDEAIGDPIRMMSRPHESLRDCYSLLQVLEQEFGGYAGALIARLYYDAFQISIAHGDQARASMFAERAHEARVICEGEDSPETVRVKSLALKPAQHSSFRVYSRKWQTTRQSIPKGLDTVQFNKWLFRQES